MHHILKTKGPMKASQILTEAKSLHWDITDDEAKASIDFLKKIDLIKIQKTKK
jgi:hypothetical protein